MQEGDNCNERNGVDNLQMSTLWQQYLPPKKVSFQLQHFSTALYYKGGIYCCKEQNWSQRRVEMASLNDPFQCFLHWYLCLTVYSKQTKGTLTKSLNCCKPGSAEQRCSRSTLFKQEVGFDSRIGEKHTLVGKKYTDSPPPGKVVYLL